MTRRPFLAAVLLLAAATAAEASLMDTWQEVQEKLAAEDAGGAEQVIQVLQDQATELGVRRMPAFASALVVWAEANPGPDGEAMLRAARQLDPKLPPAAYFLEARWERQRGSLVRSFKAQLSGWVALLRSESTRSGSLAWLALWGIFAFALSQSAMMSVVVLRHLRNLAHDLRALGGELFQSGNAWVFTIVVLFLPLFAGLGPIWLGVYLFAGCWIYLGTRMRVWAAAACLLMTLVVPSAGCVQDRLLEPAPLSSRLLTVLEERQVDFAIVKELIDLEPMLAQTGSFHLVLGELFRMHGEPGLARIQFQKAVASDPDDSRALIFVGNLALEEGDTKRALQILNSALEIDRTNPFAYHNLSLAYDLVRRFEEGDMARARAREYKGADSPENGLRGLDPRIRFPRLGRPEVALLESDLATGRGAAAGESADRPERSLELFSSLSLVFVMGLVLGLVQLAARTRMFPAGRECAKCGMNYRLESVFGESTVYCPQCVSVFLKRDVVSIEAQTAKLQRIRNWERLTALGRRAAGLLFPGVPYLFGGQVLRGVLFAFVAYFLLTGALIFVPLGVPVIEPLAGYRQLQIGMLVVVALLALRSMTMSWERR